MNMSKRVLDVGASATGLILLAPIMAAIALVIKASSSGPAFFHQERVGLDGRTFRIHKFRTMRSDHHGASLTAAGDTRVTSVGAILRKTKMDEIPQLANVLKGEMSLVGPRPELPSFVAHWPENKRSIILSVRPGITDPASITFRNEADLLRQAEDPEAFYIASILPRKLAAYEEYVRQRSLAYDLRILASTLKAVVAS